LPTVSAALLTLVANSMNDKIVVFDKIRENLKLVRRHSLPGIVNTSIDQVKVRTVITSSLSFFMALVLFVFVEEVIKGFASEMVVGIVISTYSTFVNASTLLVIWSNYRDRKKALVSVQGSSGVRNQTRHIPAAIAGLRPFAEMADWIRSMQMSSTQSLRSPEKSPDLLFLAWFRCTTWT
jgi:hypothetical protein